MATVTESPPVVAVAALAAHPGAIQRASRWTRFRAWLRLAYTDFGSKEHHLVLESIVWMVILSVVVTGLQPAPSLNELYRDAFRVIETSVLIVFAADYALNLYFAPTKRSYIFSFSGIVDLIAILPSFLIFFDASSVKFLRAVRFLRILRVLKAVHHRASASEPDEENHSLLLDLQLGVIGVSALLLLVHDDALRNLLLFSTLAIAITTGLRRWLVYRQMPAASIGVMLACVIGAMVYAQQLDAAGQTDWAVWFVIGCVAVAVVTWSRIEGPAGI